MSTRKIVFCSEQDSAENSLRILERVVSSMAAPDGINSYSILLKTISMTKAVYRNIVTTYKPSVKVYSEVKNKDGTYDEESMLEEEFTPDSNGYSNMVKLCIFDAVPMTLIAFAEIASYDGRRLNIRNSDGTLVKSLLASFPEEIKESKEFIEFIQDEESEWIYRLTNFNAVLADNIISRKLWRRLVVDAFINEDYEVSDKLVLFKMFSVGTENIENANIDLKSARENIEELIGEITEWSLLDYYLEEKGSQDNVVSSFIMHRDGVYAQAATFKKLDERLGELMMITKLRNYRHCDSCLLDRVYHVRFRPFYRFKESKSVEGLLANFAS